jgi:AraC-like DNA-binding protein
VNRTPLAQISDWAQRAHAARNCPVELAKGTGYSLREVERHFRSKINSTPHAWMHEIRLARAVCLVALGESIKAAAYSLGYKYPCHFTRDFKARFGISPRAFRARIQALKNNGNSAYRLGTPSVPLHSPLALLEISAD